MKPLNPQLFRLLELHFQTVLVSNDGCGSDLVRSPRVGSDGKMRWSAEIKNPSYEEQYRVNCPFCSDTRQRLYIHYRFGRDAETGRDFRGLAWCHNEECTDNPATCDQLYEMIFAPAWGGAPKASQIRPGRPAGPPPKIEYPGPTVRIDELPEEHPAVLYVEERGFDPGVLGRVWDVRYCPTKYSNRIIIPMHRKKAGENKLVGWQARYIGNPPPNVPKYLTCPGMRRNREAYNFGRAIRHRTIAIVEGPTDVWSFGLQAMGLWGKVMSNTLQQRLVKTILHHRDQTVVVLLDPKQNPKEKEKGKPHHIERLVRNLSSELRRAGIRRQRVFGVYLPEELDPGSMEQDSLWQAVQQEADILGLDVSFGRASLRKKVKQ